MSLQRDYAGEILTATEDHREPMVSYLGILFKRPLEENALKSAVEKMIRANAKLGQSLTFESGRLVWHPSKFTETHLASEIVVGDNVSLEDFLNQSIPIQSGPGWRLKIVDQNFLHIAVHHGICDGTAIIKIISSLAEALQAVADQQSEVPSIGVSDLEKRGVPFFWNWKNRWMVRREIFKKVLLAKYHPPIMLGDLALSGKKPQRQLYATLGAEDFTRLRRSLVDSPHVRNLTDALLMALHLTIAEFQNRNMLGGLGGDDRIAIMLPMDLRGSLPTPESLWNNVGTIIVHSRLKDRKDFSALLKCIRPQTQKLEQEKKNSSSYAILRYFSDQMEKKGGEILSGNWRFDSTACLSHIPQIIVSPLARSWIQTIYGAPPAKTPMGISIGVGGFDKSLSLCMRFSETALSPEKAAFFFERFQKLVWEIATWR